MTAAFIAQVQPQLQPDPNEETAALLRVLIHKIDNTTFGGDIPALPQWTGPPRTVIHVQSILYASLAASLLSAFFAMLGKQWLNRYASIDMRGSAIERSQNRQRKLDGIVAWYFNHVLESLPLMLQAALLLLGCALSKYLWEIDITVASVVVGATFFGILFYAFIAIAGAASESCPYQTPWTNIIRRLFYLLAKNSGLYWITCREWGGLDKRGIIVAILLYPIALPFLFVFDVVGAAFCSLTALVHKVHGWLFGTSTLPEQMLDHQATLDFRCILWMLQTSLDKTINVSTLRFLGTILPFSGPSSVFNSVIAMDCFKRFLSCFVTDGLMVSHGSEQLVETSAMCFLCTFSYLLVSEPTSTIMKDFCLEYMMALGIHVTSPSQVPSSSTLTSVVHRLFLGYLDRPFVDWRCYNPSVDELVPIAHALSLIAQFEYHRRPKVPRWLVRFALRFLSQNPLPPTSVIDCLTIIATDLGYSVSDINDTESDERCVCTPEGNQFFANPALVHGMINFLLQ